MTVQELTDLLADFDPDMPVAVAYQPNYPLQAGVQDVRVAARADEPEKVYIFAAGNDGYGPQF